MIEAKDLRLGNLLYFNGQIIKVSITDLDWIQKGEQLYKPIPLTEERLLKASFEKVNHISGYTFYSNKKFKLSVYLDRKLIEWMGYSTASKLEVHAIQNLIHALTGQELEFQE